MHVDALDAAQCFDDLVGVVGVASRAGDVDAQPVVSGGGDVERGHDAAGTPRRTLVSWLTAVPPAGTSSRTVIE